MTHDGIADLRHQGDSHRACLAQGGNDEMFGLIAVGVGCESPFGDFANGGFIPWGFGPDMKDHLECPRGKNSQ